MRGEFKLIMVFVLLAQCCFISSCQCFKPKPGVWISDATLDEFFMDIESLKVEEIIICTPDDDHCDHWTSLFEISEPGKIRQVVEALETARRGFMPAWSNRMKIITENKKFIMEFDWNDKIAYGTHWESKQLRDLLKEWGFPEPKPSYLPQGHEKVPRKVWQQ